MATHWPPCACGVCPDFRRAEIRFPHATAWSPLRFVRRDGLKPFSIFLVFSGLCEGLRIPLSASDFGDGDDGIDDGDGWGLAFHKRLTHARLFKVALACGAALVAMVSAAAAENLTDAMSIAYDTNPNLRAARAQLRATDENVAIAMSGWRPSIIVNGDVAREHVKTINPSGNGYRRYWRNRGRRFLDAGGSSAVRH